MVQMQLFGKNRHLTRLSPAALERIMQNARRPFRRASLLLAAVFCLALSAMGAEKSRIKALDYVIDAEINPKTHFLTAHAKVKFTALDDVNFASFELNNALRPTRILDANGKPMNAERISQDNVVRVAFPGGLAKGTTTTLTFEYEGKLATADDSPVEGLKLAYVGEDVTYLLYPGRWFPITNYGIDRFTSTITVTAPAGTTIIGSGATASAVKAALGKIVSTFSWQRPSFPGTIIAGPFAETVGSSGNIRVYTQPGKKQLGPAYAATATKEVEYFSSIYGPPSSPSLKIVELPDHQVPPVDAPESAAISSRDITEKVNYRLLADTIAHQWWGVTATPVSQDYSLLAALSPH